MYHLVFPFRRICYTRWDFDRNYLLCRQWNEYVQLIPQLWATIILDYSPIPLTSIDSNLERSKGAPIHIFMSQGILPHINPRRYIHGLAIHLRPHLSRLETLLIYLVHPEWAVDWFLLSLSDLPLYQRDLIIPSLTLCLIKGPSSCFTTKNGPSKISLPKLQRLNIGVTAHCFLDTLCDESLISIRDLSIRFQEQEFLNISAGLSTISKMSNLETLRWWNGEPLPRDPPFIPSVFFPKLRELKLSMKFPDDSMKIFQRLDAPLLESLSIRGIRWGHRRYAGGLAFHTILDSSIPSLRYLCLEDMVIGSYEEAVLQSWLNCKNLERLVILHCEVHTPFFNVMSHGDRHEDSRILPNIRVIYMSGSRFDVLDLETFVRSIPLTKRSMDSIKILRSHLRGNQKKSIVKIKTLIEDYPGTFSFTP